jgi:MFS family permease
MKRSILVFGLISGAIISTFMATMMAIMGCSNEEMGGGAGSMIIGFTAMAVAFSFIFVGIKNFRDKQNGGVITFGKAFLLGFMISLVASTLYVLTWAVEFHYFFPDFMDKYAAMQVKQLHESGLSGARLDEALKEIETASYNYKNNGFFFAMYTYMEILPVGIIITLISALILKRKTAKENLVPST